MASDRQTRHRAYRALLERAQGDAAAMASLARLMHGDGLKDEAADLARRALALDPAEARVRSLARETLSADVPAWHFWMLKDALRNAAYETALRRAITPASRVLEIGTGSGLLAMMAARAGARHVHTCEEVPAIAQAAREIVALNGLADRVTVLTGHSSALSPADIGGPADVLVSEIVSNDLLGEGVLPAVADAKGRLVVDGGAIVPAAGNVRVALARHRRFGDRRVRTVGGFDLSPFNRLARPFYRLAVDDADLSLCSEPATLFRFDFAGGESWPPGAAAIDLTATGDGANGVVQWIALEMDAAGLYENRPGTMPISAWAVRFHPLEAAPDRGPRGSWRVHGRHEAASLRIWAEPLGAPEG